MTCSRRRFLAALAAIPPAAALSGCSEARPDAWLIGPHDGPLGAHYVGGLDVRSGATFRVSVSTRGHSVALHPFEPHVALAARRPGRVLTLVDRRDERTLQTLTCPEGRHLLGHCAYSPDGARLYATENVFEEGPEPDLTPLESTIAVYDALDDYRRVGELRAHGVGAHQLGVMPDQRTLVVANGGIYTHPRWPRQKLNLEAMDPSLVLLDAETGSLRAQHRLAHPQLSIRHLDVGADGTVAVGLQYEGPAEDRVPLVAVLRDGQLEPLELPEDVRPQLAQYVGAVAIDVVSGRIAATSPRGDRVVFFDADGGLAGVLEGEDVSGCAAADGGFLLTVAHGGVVWVDAGTLRVEGVWSSPETRWDNHFAVWL